MTPFDGGREVQSILQELERTWTFDSTDLGKPSSEEALKQYIHQRRPDFHARLEDEFFATGPLTPLLNDPSLQEIVVNGPGDIWFERDGVFSRSTDVFFSEITFKNFIDRLCSQAHLKVDLAQPFADGRWREFRVHLGCAPLTHCPFHLTLRRIPENPWTLEKLGELEWATPDQLNILKRLIREGRNLLFVGPTGCGKTSVLSACLRSVPEDERAVIIEDTDELPRPNSASTKLLTRPVSGELPEVTLADLVRQSLRMRPQRIVMGEVRGAEAKDLLLALATGHSGSLGTLHAAEPKQALLRLEMLVQLGAPQWNVNAIRQLIQFSLDGLVVCGFHNHRRRLEGIYKVAALESFGFLLEPWA